MTEAPQEHESEQVGELREHLPDDRWPLGRAQFVRAEGREPGCRLRRGQALRGAFQRVEDLHRRRGGDAASDCMGGREIRSGPADCRRRGVRRHV